MASEYPALSAIGRTPLLQLRRILPRGSGRVLVKLESANPTGSMKAASPRPWWRPRCKTGA